MSYVLLASLLVAGSSAFAMMGEEGISGNKFTMLKSTALRLLNKKESLEINDNHYKVIESLIGKTGKKLTKAPDEMLTFSNHLA